MKDLFANLYNKVLSFFHQTETAEGEASKNVACNRLKLVLMQDRTNLSPAIMDRMRHELIDLLSKYLELDRELLDLNFEQEDEQMALMLSIPVLRAREESEIEKELAALDAEKAKKEEEAAAEEDVEKGEETSQDGETQEEIIEIVEAEPVDKAETSEGKPSDEEKVVIEEEIVISEPENEKEPKIEITD